jgi:hypothetical protein
MALNTRIDGGAARYDPVFPIVDNETYELRISYEQHVATSLRKYYDLDQLTRANGGHFNFTFSEWLDMDPYFRRAVREVMQDIEYNTQAAQKKYLDTLNDNKAKHQDYGIMGPPGLRRLT